MNKEFLLNLLNSFLAGVLVLLGGLSTGEITSKTFLYSGIAAATVFIIQFKKYCEQEIAELNGTTKTFFSFVN